MLAATGAVLLLVTASASAHARLAAPRLGTPGARATVQALPAFTWRAVRGADHYEFEFSASRDFSSGVNGFGTGPMSVQNTAISNASTIPNGVYYWRVRAVDAAGDPGRWSALRRLAKRWTRAPKPVAPFRTTVNWPTQPLIFQWTMVPYAVGYTLEVGTSPDLSKLVYGPVTVQGPRYVFPSSLPRGTYYWRVQPLDASGTAGAASKVTRFTWAWASSTTVSEQNVSPDPAYYEEPSFSWTPIPGAASYELQVSTDPSYPSDAIILDQKGVISTGYTPTSFFPNHTTLYWRVRAIDLANDAGDWNYYGGSPNTSSFTETFDNQEPTIQNLHVVDQAGNPIDGVSSDSDPIVRWSAVPGASEYRVLLAPWYASGPVQGCNFNDGHVLTSTTPVADWTPSFGSDQDTNTTSGWQGEYDWPGTVGSGGSLSKNLINGQGYCIDVVALRLDSPLTGSQIASLPQIDGSSATPAFTYTQPQASGTFESQAAPVAYSPGVVQPEYGGGAVAAGGTVTTTPLFEWQPVSGAYGYYVIVANHQDFDPNSIVTGAFTYATAWSPPKSLADQTGDYWWEVLPVGSDGQPAQDAYDLSAVDGAFAPQPFQKNSNPPTPVTPVSGANEPTQPIFTWLSAEGAKDYTIEISADSTFANPIDTDTTDSTSYTSSSTLPPGETLYWRVRANDISNSLNWSPVQTFTHNLPAPKPTPGDQSGGSTIPMLGWAPVSGASSYNIVVTAADGSTSSTPLDAAQMTPAQFFAPGISRWQVQAVFPGGATSALSGPAVTFKRTIPAPGGIRASKSGARIVITWQPDSIAKAYAVQLATNPDFSSTITSTTTVNTNWVPQLSAAQASGRLYWRLAVIDPQGNVGAYHTGRFRSTAHVKKQPAKKPKKSKHRR